MEIKDDYIKKMGKSLRYILVLLRSITVYKQTTLTHGKNNLRTWMNGVVLQRDLPDLPWKKIKMWISVKFLEN